MVEFDREVHNTFVARESPLHTGSGHRYVRRRGLTSCGQYNFDVPQKWGRFENLSPLVFLIVTIYENTFALPERISQKSISLTERRGV